MARRATVESTQSLAWAGARGSPRSACASRALAVYLFPNAAVGLGWIAFIGSFALHHRDELHAQRIRRFRSLLFYAFTFLEGIFIAPIVTYYAAHRPETWSSSTRR